MSTNVTDLTVEQAVLLAVQVLKTNQTLPTIAELAERADISRQYLYRLANKQLKNSPNEKAPAETDALSTTAEADAIAPQEYPQ